MSKRKRPDPKSSTTGLNEHESKLYEVIRSKQGMGASKAEMRSATNIIDAIVTRSIKSLMTKNLIKEVQNINNRGLKLYMSMEFEPSTEITGGVWYTDGALNVSFIETLKEICVKILKKNERGVVTLDDICKVIDKAVQVTLSREQVKEILKNLILDNVVMEVISNGMNEFTMMKMGEICYKLTGKKSGDNGDLRIGAFAAVPCGVCPRIGDCSPDGIISPKNCVYFQKWLDF